MSIRWLVSISLIVLTCFCIPQIFKYRSAKETTTSDCYVLISTIKGAGHMPYFEAVIENQKFFVGLDLGFNGDAAIDHSFLQEINEKEFVRTSSSTGIRGNVSEYKVYKIPKIGIKHSSFHHPLVDEEHESFKNDGMIIPCTNEFTPVRKGTLGWKLFNHATLYLDLANSNIAISDSVETFQKRGYSLAGFTKTRFLDDRGMVEFEAMTCNGSLRCMLDTGCTSNLLNKDSEESLEKLISDPNNFIHFSSFKIAHQDFGGITFRPLPIKFPMHIEAIVGMEFFYQHRVLIDFKNRQLYFAKNEIGKSSNKEKY